jgi:protein-ribulosamine 3-kinase
VELNHSVQVVSLGETGRHMCEGEYESLKAIYSVTPGFVPKPFAWGRYGKIDTYFLLAEFRDVGEQVSFS